MSSTPMSSTPMSSTPMSSTTISGTPLSSSASLSRFAFSRTTFARLMAMIPVAILATLALIYLMHRLVDVQFVNTEQPPEFTIRPFIMEEPIIETRVKKVEKPAEPEDYPEIPDIDIAMDLTGPDNAYAIPAFNSGVDIDIKADGGFGGGSLIRSVAVPPQYPGRALVRGIEGYVDIAFDVTAYGATTNVRILTAQPPGVFENAATKAVKRWKYKPLMVDGVATAAYGIKERIRFSIEND